MTVQMTTEERLGRIDEKLDQLTKALPAMNADIEELKEFKWKLIGQVCVLGGLGIPIYTSVVTYLLLKVFQG